MRLLAYCDRRYERVTLKLWRALSQGSMFITSPPYEEPHVPPIWLRGYDAIYIDLHGDAGDKYLHGDGTRALSLDTVRAADLGGAVVFLTTCYLPETDFIKAFLDAGASAVIGGGGQNWGGRIWARGAQKLAAYFLELYAKDLPAEFCLKCAKHRLRWNVTQRTLHPKASLDALEFELWRRE